MAARGASARTDRLAARATTRGQCAACRCASWFRLLRTSLGATDRWTGPFSRIRNNLVARPLSARRCQRAAGSNRPFPPNLQPVRRRPFPRGADQCRVPGLVEIRSDACMGHRARGLLDKGTQSGAAHLVVEGKLLLISGRRAGVCLLALACAWLEVGLPTRPRGRLTLQVAVSASSTQSFQRDVG